MSFTAIYIPDFPVTAWRRSSSRLLSEQLAVVDGVPPQETVISLSRSARNAGIELGMSKAQADAAGTIQCRPRDLPQEVHAFTEAFEIAGRFSPRIETVASPANAYGSVQQLAAILLLDSTGITTLFGTLENYAKNLQAALTAAGFTAGIGAAPNAEAALLFARSGHLNVCVQSAELRKKLASLPVSLLSCEVKTLAVLKRWGIRSLGELAALPEAALISRLGQAGRRLQQLAAGEAEHLLVPEEPKLELSEITTLDSPLELLESLLFALSPMLEAILRKATSRACALRSVRLILALERGPSHSLEVRPAVPTQNREVLLKLLNLELLAHPPRCGIVSVTMDAEIAQPHTAQRGLFQTQFPEPDRLELLLARLRSIAGEENVGSPQLLNSSRHDAFAMAPFQPELDPRAKGGTLPARLAVRIFRPPQPVQVTCCGDQPRTMYWQGAKLIILSVAGPWHSSGSWWDGHAWDADLWDVVTAEPVQALRLQQEHASKAWVLVGQYD